jgi:hypothetical protein
LAGWKIVEPSRGAWHHIVITYDGGSTANDPVIYVDGASVTVTELAAPVGTINTANTGAYVLGNRAAGDRNMDGMLGEFAAWDAILDAAEARALGTRGYSPQMIRPQSLVEYVPMVRDNVSLKRAAPTITGTAVQPHPRVIYPSADWVNDVAAAASGHPTMRRWGGVPGMGRGGFTAGRSWCLVIIPLILGLTAGGRIT